MADDSKRLSNLSAKEREKYDQTNATTQEWYPLIIALFYLYIFIVLSYLSAKFKHHDKMSISPAIRCVSILNSL